MQKSFLKILPFCIFLMVSVPVIASILATSTVTNLDFTITKLLAKAVSGACPTDPNVYVPNLNGVLAGDKICVRLVYNNATTGAISSALLTDSIPAT